MRKLVLAVLALSVGFSTHAEARGYHKRAVKAAEMSYAASDWIYRKWVPWGAYQTTVTYGPGNRRCVSQLLPSPSGWWIPTKRCETTVSS